MFTLWHAFNHKHIGRQLKYLTKLYEEKPQREILEEQQLLVKNKGKLWSHIAKNLARLTVTANPQSFRAF